MSDWTVPLEERLWSRVERGAPDECWPWRGAISPDGYGFLSKGNKKSRAHRVAYELAVGPVPVGLQLDHLCRNRSCVNPRHLEPVTQRVNVLRGVGPTATNAQKAACPHGHDLTPANTYTMPDGRRECRTCKRRRRSEYKKRRAARDKALAAGAAHIG